MTALFDTLFNGLAIGSVLMLAALAPWSAATVAPTILAPTAVVAQEPGAETSADGAEAGKDGKSYLVFLAEALGLKYIIVFMVLSFALVALLVMCFLQIRKAVLMPADLSQQFEQHLEAKEYQQAFEGLGAVSEPAIFMNAATMPSTVPRRPNIGASAPTSDT